MEENRAGKNTEDRKTAKKKILRRILLAAAVLAVLYVLANSIVPVAVVSGMVNRRYGHSSDERLEKGQGRFVKTSDGEEIWMRICPAEDPKGAVIFISGLKGPAATDYQAHADWMNGLGYTAVLMELRAHGVSGGDRIGLGYLETEDVRAVLGELRKDPALQKLPVYLLGVSMGGAVALNAFGEFPEIAGVIALSPFASFEDVFEIRMEKAFVPPLTRRYVSFLIRSYLGSAFGEDVSETRNPKDEILKAEGRPVFLIVSRGDRRVPYENALILKEVCPEAELWIREGSDHLVVKGNDLKKVGNDEEYRLKIQEWLEKNAP